MRTALALLLAALGVARAQAQGQDGDVFDRVAAVVGQQVITQNEVDLVAQIQLVRLGRYAKLEASRRPEIRAKTLEYLIAQALIYEEARRLAFQQIRKDDVERELKAFRSKFPSLIAYRKFLAENELAEADVGEIFRRNLLSNKFAEDTVRLIVQIRPSEVDAYLEKNRTNELFEKKRPEEAWELARRILFRERYEKALAEWIASLRRRTAIRVLLQFR